MTVKELIEELSQHPDDTPVHYEDGYYPGPGEEFTVLSDLSVWERKVDPNAPPMMSPPKPTHYLLIRKPYLGGE